MPKKNKLKKTKAKNRKDKSLQIISLVLVLFVIFLFSVSFLKFLNSQRYRSVLGLESTEVTIPPTSIQLIEHGSRTKHKIALTFDADMTPGMVNLLKEGSVKSWYDKRIKDYLDKEKVKATVFFTGLWVDTYPKEALALAHDPLFQIGNHTYSHPAFTQNCYGLRFVSNQGEEEISRAQEEIIRVTGVVPRYFRFPGGCYQEQDINLVSKNRLKAVGWDVVGGDAFNQNVEGMVANVEANAQNGSIIVYHISYGPYAPKTYDALRQIIPFLKSKGFQFVKVSEVI